MNLFYEISANKTFTVTFFFFLNQQFIIWSAVADCGSYFVTMYRRTESTWRVKKEKRKEKKDKKREKNKKENIN